MKKNIVIVALLALLAWREYSNYNAIQWTIQNTSDDLLIACEARIDEITAQRNNEAYSAGFSACLEQF